MTIDNDSRKLDTKKKTNKQKNIDTLSWSKNLFSKIGIHHFSYFMMWNLIGKKIEKLMIQRFCIADKWAKERKQIDTTLLARWVPN